MTILFSLTPLFIIASLIIALGTFLGDDGFKTSRVTFTVSSFLFVFLFWNLHMINENTLSTGWQTAITLSILSNIWAVFMCLSRVRTNYFPAFQGKVKSISIEDDQEDRLAA